MSSPTFNNKPQSPLTGLLALAWLALANIAPIVAVLVYAKAHGV